MRLFSLHRNRRFLGLGFTAFAILFVTLFSAFNSQPVSAATNLSDETSAATMFKAIKYYHAVEYCDNYNFFRDEISGADIDGGLRNWLVWSAGSGYGSGITQGQEIDIGIAIDSWGDQSGTTRCSGESSSELGWLSDAFTMFGISPSGGVDSLKKMGYACTISNGTNTCTKNNADASILSVLRNSTYLKGSDIGNTSSTTYKVATYWGAIETLRKGCGGIQGGNTNIVQDIPILQNNGSIDLQDWSLGKTGSVTGSVVPLNNVAPNKDSCNSDLVDAAKNNVSAYQLWKSSPACKESFPTIANDANALNWCAKGLANSSSNPTYCVTATGITGFNGSSFYDYRNACFLGAGHPVDSSGTTAGVLCMGLYTQNPLISACINGALNKSNANYCNTTYADASLQTAKDACIKGAALSVTGGGLAFNSELVEDAAAGEFNSCAVEWVGWLICPAITFLATISDQAYTFLADNFLNIDVELFATDSGTFRAWSIMRTFANIAFVITFLVIIFSQLTGAGITNYGVKKLLPKLVISAILVNVSFFLCQLAADLSNILGVSIKNLLDGVADTAVGAHYSVNDQSNNWVGIAGSVLAGTAIAWSLGLSVLLPVLVGSVVSILMILLILILREVLIILLIAISPLAFVAYLLPNTEQWFKKWGKMFVSLLMIYPVAGLLYGASNLASSVLKTAYQDTGDVIGQTAAAGVLFMGPALLIPFLKSSLKATGSIGAWASKKASMGSDGFAGKAKSRVGKSGLVQSYGARKAEKKAAISTGRYKGWNLISRGRSRINKGLNNSAGFNTFTAGYGANRTLQGQSQERKDTQEAMAMFGNDDTLVEEWAKSGGDIYKVPAGVLNENQKRQFMLLKNAGHANKSTSFTAAAQYLSENGKGSSASFVSALQNARTKGANDTDIDGAWASGMASYRKAGRGDTVGELQYAMNLNQSSNESRKLAGKPPMTLAEEMVGQGGFSGAMSDPAQSAAIHNARTNGWKEIAPSSVHRDGVKFNKNHVDAAGNPLRDATGRVHNDAKTDGYRAYEAHLGASRQHLESAVSGYNGMDARTQKSTFHAIIEAAQNYQAANPTTTPGTPITSIQDAKNLLGIK